MAHSLSAKKRIRQNETRRAENRGRKLQIKLSIRDYTEALTSGDQAKSAETLRAAIRRLDKVAAAGTIHKNTASRRKAQLQKKYNALVAGAKA